MKLKNLSILATVLVVLVGIIIVSNQVQNKKPSENSLVFLPEFSEATCSQIAVTEANQTAKIARKGTSWVVEGSSPNSVAGAAKPGSPLVAAPDLANADNYPADSASVQIALEKLKGLKKEDLISQNPQKQADLEVDSAKAAFVEVFNDKGKSLGAVYLGKNGANWDQNFVREKGSSDVYLVGGSVRNAFFGDAKRWKDKSIVKFNKAFVKKLQIAKKDSGTVDIVHITPSPTDTLVKEGWAIENPEKVKAKKDKVEDVINTLSNLLAADFETDLTLSADSMGFNKPSLVITVTLQNGETKSVIIGKKKTPANQFWAKNPENGKAVFLANDYNVTSLGQTLKTLKDVPEVKKDTPVAPVKEIKKVSKKK